MLRCNKTIIVSKRITSFSLSFLDLLLRIALIVTRISISILRTSSFSMIRVVSAAIASLVSMQPISFCPIYIPRRRRMIGSRSPVRFQSILLVIITFLICITRVSISSNSCFFFRRDVTISPNTRKGSFE